MDTPPSNCTPPTPKTYTYKTVDNLALEADVFVPTTSIHDKYPVVFCIHGGGYIFGAKEDGYTPKELEELLSRGWCVVSINYRLAPYAFFQDMIQDIQDAYHWVRTELVKTVPLDVDSVILLGQSAGGGLVLTSGFMLSPRPQAIIAFYPAFVDFTESVVFDSSTPVSQTIIEEMKAHIEPSSAYAFKKAYAPNTNDPKVAFFSTVFQAKKLGWMLATHNPDESAESVTKVLKEYSTAFHVDSKYPPTVLVHGVKDEAIPQSESINMAKRLEEANVPHLLKLIPEAIHGFNFIPNAMPAGAWEEYVLPAFDFAGKFVRNADSKVESK